MKSGQLNLSFFIEVRSRLLHVSPLFNNFIGGIVQEITIEVNNWEQYQSNSDKLRMPHWFKMSNDIITSESLFGLNFEQKWIWICVLALCSKRKCAKVRIQCAHFVHMVCTSESALLQAIEIFEEKGLLTVDRQSTDSSLTVYRQTEEKRREENRIIYAQKCASELPVVLLEEKTASKRKRLSPKNEDHPFLDAIRQIYEGDYPKKRGWSRAVRRLRDSVKITQDLEDFAKAVKNYKQETTNTEKQFIKYFDTFASCWRDWINVEPAKTSNVVDWGDNA